MAAYAARTLASRRGLYSCPGAWRWCSARARWLCVLAASRLEAQRHRPAFKRATYSCRSTEPRSPGPMISLSCSAPNGSDAKRWLASYAVASSNELRFRPLIAAARERFPFFAHLRQGARMRRPAQPPKRIDGLLKAASLRSWPKFGRIPSRSRADFHQPRVYLLADGGAKSQLGRQLRMADRAPTNRSVGLLIELPCFSG